MSAASACLAALAMVLIGWQALGLLDLAGIAETTTPAPDRAPWQPMLVAAAACGSVLALMWIAIRNGRARQRAEARLHWMAHRLPGAFYAFRLSEDGRGTYEFLSINAGKLLGVSREQVIKDARVVHRLVVPDDRTRLNAELARSSSALSPLDADFRIRKPDGEIRWIRTLAVPVRESNRDLVWTGHLFDITEIRAAEQDLRYATQRLEDAQRVAHFGDWTCDLATGALTWSPQVYRLFEREPSLGPPSLDEALATLLEGPASTVEAFGRARATGEPQSFETTARLPSGNQVALHVNVLPVADEAGNVTGMRGTIQDITSRKALEQRLSQAKEAADAANKAKSAFLATMSHEIRTPLNGMLGILELISLSPLEPDLRMALQDVRDSGKSLQRIIDDILDFSKVEAGKLEIQVEATCLSDVVESVYRIHAGSGSTLGLDFRRYVDPDISPALMLDALRLRQVLSNFVSNAIKFTSKGSVELRASLQGRDGGLEHLRFEVADTGIGISAEEQKKLFEPFEQAQSIASRFGGTGLGLSISRGLAELMGGRVSMSSELGVGTTMILDIPARVAEPALAQAEREGQAGIAESAPGGPSPAAVTADPSLLILVVDDHPINRMVMHRQINAIGYATEDVESAQEALERWRTGRFSLVLTDLNMPNMSGYDLSRAIRQDEAGSGARRTPIIACSANVIPGVIQDCEKAGIDDYIAKPTRLRALSETLARWLPAPAGQSETRRSPPPDEGGDGQRSKDNDAMGPASATRPEAPQAEAPRAAALSPRALALFREVNEADVRDLLDAVARGDMANVAHKAHRIKGACCFIGATGLASVCAMIEEAGREQDRPGTEWLMDSFHTELEKLNAILE